MKTGLNFFKTLAFTGMMLTFFPVIVFAQVYDYERLSPNRILLFFLLGAGALLFGMLLDKPFTGANIPRRFYFAFARIAALSFGLAAFFIRNPLLLADAEFFALIMLLSFCCMLGFHKRGSHFGDVFYPPALAGFAVISTLVMLWSNAVLTEESALSDLSKINTWLVLICIIEFTIAAVLLNQTNIETQVKRRSDIKVLIPEKIRIYNLSLIIFLAILFAFGYLFRSFIAGGILLAVEGIRYLIYMILSLFITDSDPNVPQELAGNEPNVPALFGVLSLILNAVFSALVIFILIKARRAIIHVIKSTFAYITSLLRLLFKPKPRRISEEAEYEDFFEALVYEKEVKRAQPNLKNLFRLYEKEKNPVNKIRISYRIFLHWLGNSGAEITPADTVEAHLLHLDNPDELREYAGIYSNVRYGEVQILQADDISKADEIVRGCK